VLGRVPGVARIVARSEAISGVAIVTVIPEPVAGVKLSAPAGPLKPGESIQLVASAHGANGVSLAGRRVTWGTSDSAVATVAGGRVTGQGPGTATITATIDGRQASTSVQIVPPPPTVDPAAEQARAVQETTRLLDGFVDALSQRDLARLKTVYPGMPVAMEEGWRRVLHDPRLNKMQATREPLPPLRGTGQDNAEVPFTVHLKASYSGVPATSVTIRYLAIFQQTGGKWLLQRLDEKK
jgi:hypothetical protein